MADVEVRRDDASLPCTRAPNRRWYPRTATTDETPPAFSAQQHRPGHDARCGRLDSGAQAFEPG
jgi:hypothetical protein